MEASGGKTGAVLGADVGQILSLPDAEDRYVAHALRFAGALDVEDHRGQPGRPGLQQPG